jgi:hypothetical protein
MKNKDLIIGWIKTNLKERKKINNSVSSYGLKHRCERDLGFYVSNIDIKICMKELNFRSVPYYCNEYYNITIL